MTDAPWVSISTPYLRAGHQDAWAQEAAEHGHTGKQLLREVTELEPPPNIAAALRLAPGETAVVRRRTMLLDGHPVELTDSYYPADIARGTGLAEPRKVRGGAVTLLAELGHTASRADEDVTAREPTEDERQLLQLGDGEWVLVLTRLLTSDAGRPIEASVMTMTARGRHLRYALTL